MRAGITEFKPVIPEMKMLQSLLLLQQQQLLLLHLLLLLLLHTRSEIRALPAGISTKPELPVTNNLDHLQQEICSNADVEEVVSTMDGHLKCCTKCPPGEGMLQLCTNQTQTTCQPCVQGLEFSLVASASAKCMQCKQCQELHPFAKFRTHCSPTADAVCECIAGFFFVEAQATCRSCTKCPPGQGAERACKWNEDGVCRTCAEGTWSSSESATEDCQKCKKCKPGQIEMRPCSATQNTLCCALNNPNCNDTVEDDETNNEPQSLQKRWQHVDDRQTPLPGAMGEERPMIAIYCSLLGLIIITLLVYVFYKLWKQHLVRQDTKGESPLRDVEELHPGFTEFSKSQSISATSSDQNSLNKHKLDPMTHVLRLTPECQRLLAAPQQYSSSLHNPTLSNSLINELSNGLAVEDRWKQVGGRLGYNDETLRQFANSDDPGVLDNLSETPPSVEAARQMLTSWLASTPSDEVQPMQSLLSALECTPCTGQLCRLLKESMSSTTKPVQ